MVNDVELVRYSEFWDEKWYLNQYQDVRNSKIDPLNHFCKKGYIENRNPSLRFDTRRYRALYEVSNENPLVHYEKIGKYKGIIPPITEYLIIKKSKFFWKEWYKIKFLNGEGLDPINHYLNIGWRKGYPPSPLFDGDEYLKRNEGVKKAGVCPLVHYERNGRFEGRAIYPINRPKYAEKNRFWKTSQKIILFFNKVFMSKKIKNCMFLVVLHIFYPESWPEIKCYLDNLSIYNYDLIITYSDSIYMDEVINNIKEYKKNTVFYKYDNKGYDIGPFVDVLQKADLSKYTAVFKIHSKGITRSSIVMYGHYYKYKDWFNVLYKGILGLFNTHSAIRKILNKDIDIVAAKELIVKDPIHKKQFVADLCKQYDIPYETNYHFVAGTCMVFNTNVLRKIKSYGFSIEDFEKTTRGEFSFAHFMERIICFDTKIVGNNTCRNIISEKYYLFKIKKYDALNLYKNNNILIDGNFFYRVLERQLIEKYTIEKIRLGDIRRYFNGKYYSLESCAPYRYLLGYHYEYYKYSEYHIDNNLPLMTKKRFDELINNIESNGYDKRNLPIINQDNVIQDGQHRSCYLLFKYGPDYEIEVLKIWYKNRRREKEFYREYRKGIS